MGGEGEGGDGNTKELVQGLGLVYDSDCLLP